MPEMDYVHLNDRVQASQRQRIGHWHSNTQVAAYACLKHAPWAVPPNNTTIQHRSYICSQHKKTQ